MGLIGKETDGEKRERLIKEIKELDDEIHELLQERERLSEKYNEACKKLEKEDHQIRSLTKLIVEESVKLEKSPLDPVSRGKLEDRIDELEKATKFSRDKKLRRMGIDPTSITKRINIIEKKLDKKDKKRRFKSIELGKIPR